MTSSSDPVPEIIRSGREVVPEDVELLWSDLIEGRRTVQDTARRSQSLLDTVNVVHVANWGLSDLYALTSDGEPDADLLVQAHDAWRRHVREYAADPQAWDRRYYQRLILQVAERSGLERAKDLGARLVRSGELRTSDVTAAVETLDTPEM